ncbi:hypothetical protein [Martelella mangrovi]|uniref:Uncharacterized protein n=1 Tax=Martelella mangrovi TaxID=1397477 RepID=A0ABV2IG10_9HYPH
MDTIREALAERGRVTGGKRPLKSLGHGFVSRRQQDVRSIMRRRKRDGLMPLGMFEIMALESGRKTEAEIDREMLERLNRRWGRIPESAAI